MPGVDRRRRRGAGRTIRRRAARRTPPRACGRAPRSSPARRRGRRSVDRRCGDPQLVHSSSEPAARIRPSRTRHRLATVGCDGSIVTIRAGRETIVIAPPRNVCVRSGTSGLGARGRGDRDRRGRAPAGRCARRRRRANGSGVSITSSGVPATPFSRSSAGSRPIAAARPLDLGLVGAAAQHERSGERHRRRIAIDRVARGAHTLALGRRTHRRRRERCVELGWRNGRRVPVCAWGRRRR